MASTLSATSAATTLNAAANIDNVDRWRRCSVSSLVKDDRFPGCLAVHASDLVGILASVRIDDHLQFLQEDETIAEIYKIVSQSIIDRE